MRDGGWRNPFPGLRSFNPGEGELFFGRDSQRNELLRRLKRGRFVALVGTSGSGKSSLVRAGLIPALERGFRTRTGTAWTIASMKPGNRPVGNLAAALAALQSAGVDDDLAEAGMAATLRRSALGLIEAVRQLRPEGNVLVLIDQFEELFRVRSAPGEWEDRGAAFVRLFLEAVAQDELPIYVLITMRSDYLGDCARYQGLPEAINKGQYLVPRLSREQRREVIVGPVAKAGAEIAPRLVHRLLNDVGSSPDQLPILQHALMRTWQRWQEVGASGSLDLEHYEAIGTMADALERHAEQILAGLEGERLQGIARRLFQGLTEKGADNREVRRPILLGELCELAEASREEVVGVIEAFRARGRSFLMPGLEVELEEKTLVDISHESLIRGWGRLRSWVREESQSAEQYLRLAERAELHAEGKETFLGGPALELALAWREGFRPNEAWARRYHPGFDRAMEFLTRSQAERERQEAEQEEARRKELEQARALAREQRRRLAEQKLSSRRLRSRMVALAVVSLLAFVAAGYAFFVRQRAEKQSRLNLARERSLVALKEMGAEPEVGVLLGLYAVDATLSAGEGVTPEAARTLHLAVTAARNRRSLEGHGGPVTGAAFLEGGRLVSASRDGKLRFWNPEPRRLLSTVEAHPGGIFALAVAADRGLVATGGRDGRVRLWQGLGDGLGEEVRTLEGHDGPVSALAFSPNGETLASAGWDRTARLWSVTGGGEAQVLRGHEEALASIAFSRDGDHLATGGWDARVRIWSLPSGEIFRVLEGHRGPVTALAFNADRFLASAGWDSRVILWDYPWRHPATTFGEQAAGAITSLAFSPDGQRIATGGWDGDIRTWPTISGMVPVQTIRGLAWVNGLSFDDSGELVAAAYDDGSVVVWRASVGGMASMGDWTWSGPGELVSPGGVFVARLSEGLLSLEEAKTGRPSFYSLLASPGAVSRFAFDPAGRRLAVLGASGALETYPLYLEDMMAQARRLAPGSLTAEQCQHFLHVEECPAVPGPAPDFDSREEADLGDRRQPEAVGRSGS